MSWEVHSSSASGNEYGTTLRYAAKCSECGKSATLKWPASLIPGGRDWLTAREVADLIPDCQCGEEP